MTAYYNENEPFAAQWLRNLIAAGHIAAGDVDDRSIVEVQPGDLTSYTQCHFFAGIGVWSHALRRAGWDDNRPVWTGSCPCQPFSGTGQGGGFDDERHLWPAFFHLIEECRPSVIFGEQVASKNGLAWLDLVHADMEGADYAFGAIDLCAAGFGAPHIRQRLYWAAERVADAESSASRTGLRDHGSTGQRRAQPADHGATGELGDAERAGLEGHAGHGDGAAGRPVADRPVATAGAVGALADAASRQFPQPERRPQERNGHGSDRADAAASPTNGLWRNADWLLCRDDKWRAVEPGTFPLAHGAPARVGRLRAYGNAIVAPQAAEFIAAYMTR